MCVEFYQWAAKHGVSSEAIRDLLRMFNAFGVPGHKAKGGEQDIQQEIRLEASRKGKLLYRNNVGVTEKHVRYGLCNDSAKVNKRLKSHDLVGVESVRVTPDMVGRVIGRFLTREVKPEGWTYKGTEREQAQLRWMMIIAAMGGNSAFATGVGTL